MKRDCSNNMYPVYPLGYVGPMMPMNTGMPIPMNTGIPTNTTSTTYNYNGMDNISNQIASLEKRVSNLESIINNNYNNSTYQMM